VLLVDDESEQVEMYQLSLETAAFEVISARGSGWIERGSRTSSSSMFSCPTSAAGRCAAC